MSRWFRHYVGTVRDPKFVAVAARSKQPVERILFVWGCILESAAETNEGGLYSLDQDEVAYFLRCDVAEIEEIVTQLTARGVIAGGNVTKWSERQYESDTSASRTRRYRERKRHGDDGVTPQAVTVTPPETETETETEKKTTSEQNNSGGAVADPATDRFEEFWKAYPKRQGANPKAPAAAKFKAAVKAGIEAECIIAAARRYGEALMVDGKAGTQFVARAVTWLSEKRWGDYPAPATEAPVTGMVWAGPETPELEAWDRHKVATTGKTAPRDARGGWSFPTRWPPGHPNSPGAIVHGTSEKRTSEAPTGSEIEPEAEKQHDHTVPPYPEPEPPIPRAEWRKAMAALTRETR